MNRAFQAILVGIALLLASCGGGQLTAGIEGSGAPVTTVGSITGFGSIFVNGVEYATAGAQIGIDGQPGTEAQLSVGDVVTVVGTVNADGKTGTAGQVTFGGNVAGTVDQVNVPTQTLVVLGQTVLVTASTVFDASTSPADITGIKPGTSIEVSGFANSFGQLVASHIHLLPAAGTLRVEGVAQALNTTAHTFQVNALLVDYSAVTPSGTLADGSIVGVEGSGFSASGALQATAVEVAPAVAATPNSQGEVEGIITSFTSNADFMINGLHVTTDAGTQFTLNGATLGVNARVAVEGSFDSSGNLVAATLEALPEGGALVRGVVQALPASGTLTVLGVTVTTDPRTKLEDDSSLRLRPFHLSDLQVGDYVEARGRVGIGATLNAEVLVRQAPNSLAFLQDTATNVSSVTLTLLGVTVVVSSQTQYSGSDGAPLTAAQFFAQAPNHTVKAGGTPSGNSLLATQAQIEGP